MSDPELNIRFWRVSIQAKGAKAIEAVRRPLEVAVYTRLLIAIVFGGVLLWRGHELAPGALRYLRSFVGF